LKVAFADIFKAWDRFATMLFVTLPRRLDTGRKWRSRFMDAVR
jgi:hypothetical protein